MIARIKKWQGRKCLGATLLFGIAVSLGAVAARSYGAGMTAKPPLLIVGGGPDLADNAVGIESNVRYVTAVAGSSRKIKTLFADGDANHASVIYTPASSLGEGEQLLAYVLGEDDDGLDIGPAERFRKPGPGVYIDGPSTRRVIHDSVGGMCGPGEPFVPAEFYFTGHGGQNGANNDNNTYCLWKNDLFTVRDMAKEIARLPARTPVRVVMVQCFSGAFANLLFEGGDPKGKLIDRDLVGFFAATPEREAAGCTEEVNEAEYHDFTSYFFAALSGHDRVGRVVTGADYNHDGRVGMDEAYCYAIGHDVSIDVPMCTSDAFLRRFATISDAELFKSKYSAVCAEATEAQRAAFNELSARAHLNGEGRIVEARILARQTSESSSFGSDAMSVMQARTVIDMDAVERERQRAKSRLLRRFPALTKKARPGSAARVALRAAAVRYLEREVKAGRLPRMLEELNSQARAETQSEERDERNVYALRFIRLAKSVLLAHQLRAYGKPEIRSRFEGLVQGEAANFY